MNAAADGCVHVLAVDLKKGKSNELVSHRTSAVMLPGLNHTHTDCVKHKQTIEMDILLKSKHRFTCQGGVALPVRPCVHFGGSIATCHMRCHHRAVSSSPVCDARLLLTPLTSVCDRWCGEQAHGLYSVFVLSVLLPDGCMRVCVNLFGFKSEEAAPLFLPLPPLHRTFLTDGGDGERDVAALLVRAPLSPA